MTADVIQMPLTSEMQRQMLNGMLVEAGYPPIAHARWHENTPHPSLIEAIRSGSVRRLLLRKNDE
jgi:hypothetical protein